MSDAEVMNALAQLQGRFFGKYRGTVTEVDTQQLGRIKAKVPAVLGAVSTGWAMPCVPYAGAGVGLAFLPEPGSGVWIEFEGGDVSFPIWTGCYWRQGEVPRGVGARVKVIATAAGHEIVLDDDGGKITVTDASGGTVTLDASGITLERGGCKLEITDAKVSANDGALEVQ